MKHERLINSPEGARWAAVQSPSLACSPVPARPPPALIVPLPPPACPGAAPEKVPSGGHPLSSLSRKPLWVWEPKGNPFPGEYLREPNTPLAPHVQRQFTPERLWPPGAPAHTHTAEGGVWRGQFSRSLWVSAGGGWGRVRHGPHIRIRECACVRVCTCVCMRVSVCEGLYVAEGERAHILQSQTCSLAV